MKPDKKNVQTIPMFPAGRRPAELVRAEAARPEGPVKPFDLVDCFSAEGRETLDPAAVRAAQEKAQGEEK